MRVLLHRPLVDRELLEIEDGARRCDAEIQQLVDPVVDGEVGSDHGHAHVRSASRVLILCSHETTSVLEGSGGLGHRTWASVRQQRRTRHHREIGEREDLAGMQLGEHVARVEAAHAHPARTSRLKVIGGDHGLEGACRCPANESQRCTRNATDRRLSGWLDGWMDGGRVPHTDQRRCEECRERCRATGTRHPSSLRHRCH